jgi:hypothetical protein
MIITIHFDPISKQRIVTGSAPESPRETRDVFVARLLAGDTTSMHHVIAPPHTPGG